MARSGHYFPLLHQLQQLVWCNFAVEFVEVNYGPESPIECVPHFFLPLSHSSHETIALNALVELIEGGEGFLGLVKSFQT